jgi:hypothetical protein
MAIELGGGDAGGRGEVLGIGKGCPCERLAAEDPPLPFDEGEPGSTDRDEGLLDARVVGQPVPNGCTQMAGSIVGDEVEGATRIGLVKRAQEREIAGRIARGCGLSQRLPVVHAQRPGDPDLVGPTLVIQGALDALAVG